MSSVRTDHGGLRRAADPGHEAWETALDRLELDVIRTERVLGREESLDLEPWQVPDGHGPLPESLRQRAEEILERQRALLVRLSDRLTRTAREQSVVAEVGRSSTRASTTSAYFDVTA